MEEGPIGKTSPTTQRASETTKEEHLAGLWEHLVSLTKTTAERAPDSVYLLTTS